MTEDIKDRIIHTINHKLNLRNNNIRAEKLLLFNNEERRKNTFVFINGFI